MKRVTPYWLLLLPLGDFIAAFAGYFAARALRPITDGIPLLHSYFDPAYIPNLDFFLPFASLAALAFLLAVLLSSGYRHDLRLPLWQLTLAALFWGLILIAYFAIVRHEVIFGRIMLMQAMIFTLIFAVGLRYLWQKLHHYFGQPIRLILLADNAIIAKWKSLLKSYSDYQIVAEATDISCLSPTVADQLWLLSDKDVSAVLDYCSNNHLALVWRPTSELALLPSELRTVAGHSLLHLKETPLNGWWRVLKRVFDLLSTSFLLIILTPLFLLLALLIRKQVIYSSQRVGRNGKIFIFYKFRSMILNAEQQKESLRAKNHRQDGPFFKVKNDPRVTKLGYWLRRFSLDELPQLWNVLRGDMSLIGPRPHLPEEIKELSPQLKRILSIKPGIIGLAQVNGRSDLSFKEEMRLDLYYLQNWSLSLDAVIFLKGILVVLSGRGAD